MHRSTEGLSLHGLPVRVLLLGHCSLTNIHSQGEHKHHPGLLNFKIGMLCLFFFFLAPSGPFKDLVIMDSTFQMLKSKDECPGCV